MTQAPGRLRWQCRRGMLELDVMLNRFLDQHWGDIDNDLKQELELLLVNSDQQLQKWLCEGMEADNEVRNIVSRLRQTNCH
ncbi:MAG: succinate dehydrogenase assembly factor 2 [Arenicellales bacterium]|jgi:antitoxin CptB